VSWSGVLWLGVLWLGVLWLGICEVCGRLDAKSLPRSKQLVAR